jgi:hypothetical protein
MRNGDFSGLLDNQGRLTTIYDPMTTDTQTCARLPFSHGGKPNAIDLKRISPLAQYLFSVIPTPTYPDRNPLLENNWFWVAPDTTNQWTVTARVDHRFTDKDQFYVRHTEGSSLRIYDPYAWLANVPTTDLIGNMGSNDHRNRSTAASLHPRSRVCFGWLLTHCCASATRYEQPYAVPPAFKTHSLRPTSPPHQRLPSNALIETAPARVITPALGHSRRGASDKALALGRINVCAPQKTFQPVRSSAHADADLIARPSKVVQAHWDDRSWRNAARHANVDLV